MADSNARGTKSIHENKTIKNQKVVCGMQASKKETKAYDWRTCRVNDSLREVKRTENRESRHKTPNLLKVCRRNHKLFQCKVSSTSQLSLCNKHTKTLKDH